MPFGYLRGITNEFDKIVYSNRPAWVLSLLEIGFTVLTTAFVDLATHKYVYKLILIVRVMGPGG